MIPQGHFAVGTNPPGSLNDTPVAAAQPEISAGKSAEARSADALAVTSRVLHSGVPQDTTTRLRVSRPQHTDDIVEVARQSCANAVG